jgi:hypothetical protein
MQRSSREWIVLFLLTCVGGAVFSAGINWGVPARDADRYLFGAREPWTGRQILELAPAPTTNPSVGADADVDPIADRDEPIVLNETDAQRAEIVRRYRLFSYQPDEMITFDALSGMHPSKFQLDPRLYQYGGLWIYPVGALLKLTLNPTSDIARYLDHPEDFGRFYVVARAYVIAWGIIGIWAAYGIARRATGSLIAATAAAGLYVCLPVVVNMSHEAKPHLPGLVLMLLAIIAAMRFVETGATRWWVFTSILCGAATGMVLSAALILVIIPLMTLLRPEAWSRRVRIAVLGAFVAVAVYCATNPYVAINFFTNRAVLRSNFSNTAAMYEFGRLGEGLLNAMMLIREGMSLGVAVGAVLALFVFAARASRAGRVHPLAWLIGVPALLVTLQFVALAAGKPGEYGRFALLPDVALALAAACAVALISARATDRIVLSALLVALAAFPSWFYLLGFVGDASKLPRRLDDAHWLSLLQQAGGKTLGIYAEPAPYSLPPVDLFEWTLVLLPRGFDIRSDATDADVIVRAVDEPRPNGEPAGPFVLESIHAPSDVFPTRISWADKPFEVWVRPALIERVQRQHQAGASQPASP